MITRDTIDKINETAQIEEVVGDFVTLKKRGANLLGLCPFHNEKTPSFTVSPAKGIYKCFGCGVAGNSVNFVMELEHKSYPEALRYLADKYKIEVEETEAPSQELIEERNERDSIFIANAFAQRFYTDQLFNTEVGQSVGLSYFKERGFTTETIQKFQLGYAPDSYDAFTQAAIKEGYQLDILKKAGLASTKYDKPMDFFRDRVQFTIHDFSGKVVGFGGRTLKNDKKIPKYVNTAETDVYNKSKILYGLFFSKNDIRREDECIMVEGYTDVISLHQAGIGNVVSSSGTSLTVEQVRAIKRLTTHITIIYDGDPAGIKAALRGIDLILADDMNVRVVMLPEGEDPDSYVKSVGATEFRAYKEENSKDFILFKTDLLMKDAGKDPVKRTEVVRDTVGSIALIPDAIKRSLYIKECSALMDVQEQILITEVNKLRGQKLAKDQKASRDEISQAEPNIPIEHDQSQPEEKVDSRSAILRQERDIVRLLLSYGNLEFEEEVLVSQVILHELEEDEIVFENAVCQQIVTTYAELIENGEVPDAKYFTDSEDKALSQMAIDLLHSPYDLSENWDRMHQIIVTDSRFLFKKDITSSLCRYKIEKLALLLKENKQAIKEASEKEDGEEELMELLKTRQAYLEMRKKLGDMLGTVIWR